MDDLTGFQRDQLYVVDGLDTPNGLAIKDELDDYYEADITKGRLHPNLDTLVENGLLEKRQKDAHTNSYTLTNRGRRELAVHREWENAYLENVDAIST